MTKNRYKTVILPAEKASSLSMVVEKCIKRLSDVNVNDLKYTPKILHSEEYFQEQHLYIIDTQPKIEVGDYIIDDYSLFGPYEKGDSFIGKARGKVIASTDKELGLPDIPKQLVQEYVQKPFEYVPEKWIICNQCGSFKTGVQTGLCSTCGKFGASDAQLSRKQALEWWDTLSPDNGCQVFTDKYIGTNRHFSTLTSREIETIWHKETGGDFSHIPDENICTDYDEEGFKEMTNVNESELKAVEKYNAGEKWSVSTFIDEDTIIAGYGELYHDFEFPLPNDIIRKEYGTTSWSEYNSKNKMKQSQPRVTPELITILRACYKKGATSVTFSAGSWDEEKLLKTDNAYFVTFHRQHITPDVVEEPMNYQNSVPVYQTLNVPIWKDWYMTINYHS